MWLSKILTAFSAASVSVKLREIQIDEGHDQPYHAPKSLKKAKKRSKQLVKTLMNEVGAPGVVVAVSVDGSTVWSKGFGHCDVENEISCTPSTVMRVASISKPFTALAMASLWEEGKLDLDIPIQKYVPEFPEKQFENSKVTITLRHLLSHTSGIRHYSKNPETDSKDGDFEEFYVSKPCESVSDSLSMFKNDPLLRKPGGGYLYTTHGWTLISAILEKASGKDFLMLMNDYFRKMGMFHTEADVNHKLIYNRSRYYRRKKNGVLENAPHVDNSYKWAGGGFLSTVGDLLKFGNIMIYSYQHNESDQNSPKGLLRSDTVRKMWQAVSVPERKNSSSLENARYGLGWVVLEEQEIRGRCPEVGLEVLHTGGAVGASSVLFIMPETGPHHVSRTSKDSSLSSSDAPVCGVVVAIVCNLQSVGLSHLAQEIGREFDSQLRA